MLACAEVRGAVDRGAADVHPDKAGGDGLEVDLGAGAGVVEVEGRHVWGAKVNARLTLCLLKVRYADWAASPEWALR